MEIPASVFERFCRVPRLDISVDQDLDGSYAAQIMPTLMSADPGCEIVVEVNWMDLDDGNYEFEAGSKEMFVDLLTRTRDTFAKLFLITDLVVGQGAFGGLDEEDSKNFGAALDSLPDDFFVIDLGKALEARQKMRDEEARLTGGLQTILHVMREEGIRRGLDKEQRAKITIGDAFGLDDEDPGADLYDEQSGK